MENKQAELTKIDEKTDENVVKFAKQITFEGKEYTELHLDLPSLTGNDIELAEVQFISQNPQIAAQTPLKEMSKGFQAILAAKAAKVPVEFIKSLPASEYSKITTKVQVFLLKGE